MTTITHSTGVITPTVVDGWSASREARTKVHDILGRSDPDVTLRPAGLRAGTLKLVFATEQAAADAVAVLAVPQVLTLADADRPSLAGRFVAADGTIELQLDDETRDVWIVTCPFREVAP